MSVDERSRHELYLKLESLLGPAEADTLMAHLPPATFADLATRQDLEIFALQIRTEFGELRHEFAEFRSELRTEIAELRTELRTEMGTEIGALRTEMGTEIGALRTEMVQMEARLDMRISHLESSMLRMMLTTQIGGIVTMVGILITALVIR